MEETVSKEPEEIGPGQWDMAVEWLPPDRLLPNSANPNEQDDATFNALVRSIVTDGWTLPVTAVPLEKLDGEAEEGSPVELPQMYRIVAGEHRWRAAKVLGCDVPVLALPAEQWEKDRQDWMLVKDNILTGKLNPEKFAALYSDMQKRYDAEVLQELMGFTSSDAFQKMYKETRAALPPEMQKALDASKAEIKTIDDLSTVLNGLFAEYGETLPSNVMVFTWGQRQVFWVLADKPLWKQLTAFRARVNASGSPNYAEAFRDALETWEGMEEANDEYAKTDEGQMVCGRRLAVEDAPTFNALHDAAARQLAIEAQEPYVDVDGVNHRWSEEKSTWVHPDGEHQCADPNCPSDLRDEKKEI